MERMRRACSLFLCAALSQILVVTGASALTSAPFLVYFPHASARLDGPAMSVVRCAARAVGEFKVLVQASADTSGAADYNLDLSRRRALAIKAELVRLGFRAEHVTVEALGEKRPLIETPDGQREPRNRYAWIRPGDYVGPPAFRGDARKLRCRLGPAG